MEQVICEICGVMKPVNGECVTCKEFFQMGESSKPVEQIPMQQSYAKPTNTYTSKLDNGQSLDVYMYGVNKIVAFLKDINGNHISSEEFSDIEKFKTTVINLKKIIADELKKLEEYKAMISELGFDETDSAE
jgi:hypothetical protein